MLHVLHCYSGDLFSLNSTGADKHTFGKLNKN